MMVQDVAADGRMLVVGHEQNSSIRALVPGEAEEREFPWLGAALFGYKSRAGYWPSPTLAPLQVPTTQPP